MARRRGQNVEDKFTKSFLQSLAERQLAFPVTAQTFIFERYSPLAILCHPDGALSCYIYQRIKPTGSASSTVFKRQVCTWGDLASRGLDWARKAADLLVRSIQDGEDPKEVERVRVAAEQAEAARRSAIKTLAEITKEFIANPYGDKPRRKTYVKGIIERQSSALKEWQHLLLTDITEQMVVDLYDKLSSSSVSGAIKALKELSSIFNFAKRKYREARIYSSNPVRVLAEEQRWLKLSARKVRLHTIEFKDYIEAVYAEGTAITGLEGFYNARDALLMALFTGLRRDMILSLTLDRINLRTKAIEITGEMSKNGEPYWIPMNGVVYAIVVRRMEMLKELDVFDKPGEKFLFPANSKSGHATDTRHVRQRVKEVSGIDITNHDLRRTYKSIGGELYINQYILDDLVCHVREGSDVNTSYQVFDLEILRDASQRIAGYLCEKSGIDVVALVDKKYQ